MDAANARHRNKHIYANAKAQNRGQAAIFFPPRRVWTAKKPHITQPIFVCNCSKQNNAQTLRSRPWYAKINGESSHCHRQPRPEETRRQKVPHNKYTQTLGSRHLLPALIQCRVPLIKSLPAEQFCGHFFFLGRASFSAMQASARRH